MSELDDFPSTAASTPTASRTRVRQKMQASLSSKKSPREYLNAMKKMAESRGGKLVSTAWQGSTMQYEFRDATDHVFTSDYANVMRGRWSPHEGKISEPLCRQVLEHLFKGDFPTSRSVLLPEHNGTDFAWELDGFCAEQHLAFEYQGHPCHWNPDEPTYEKTSQRDAQKKLLCNQLGITLIQIPAFTKGSIWADDRVYQHVLAAVKQTFLERGETLPEMNQEPFEPDFTCLNKGIKQLERLRHDAAIYGLTVKDTNYPYPEFRFTMTDGMGETVQRSHRAIQKKKRLDFLMLQATASENGCTLMETDYKGPKAQHTLRTPHGDISMSGETMKTKFPVNIKTYVSQKHNKRLQRLASGALTSPTASMQSLQGLLGTMGAHGIVPSPKSVELLEKVQTWCTSTVGAIIPVPPMLGKTTADIQNPPGEHEAFYATMLGP